MAPFYLYMLRCADRSLYCGVARNVKRRVREHNASRRAAKYTRGRRPVKLVYSERHRDLSSALRREYEIKQWRKEKKETLARRSRG